MAAIKKFFEKKKLEFKFKKAGGGHKLTEDTKSGPVPSSSTSRSGPSRSGPTGESRMAAEAALDRMQGPRTGGSRASSIQAMTSQVRQEMESERAATKKAMDLAKRYEAPQEVHIEGAPVLAVSGVFYKCPLIAEITLPKKDMELCINEFLLSQLAEEPEMTSALMIHTLNKDAEKVRVCIETLCKYVDNVLQNPKEEKFRKIRVNNKAFHERVASLEGTQEFLQAAGFGLKSFPGPSGVDEMFYFLADEQAQDIDRLKALKEALSAAEPIRPELDRNRAVFYSTTNAARIQVPDEFYNVSPEDLKKEQQIRQEAVEQLGMLRTKEMREREKQKELRRYRYTLIRIRFPDGTLLQGTFLAREKMKNLLDFVRENLEMDWIPFFLSTSTGQRITDENLSLAELQLAPAAVVTFAYDPTVMAEVTAQKGSHKINHYLNHDCLASVNQL